MLDRQPNNVLTQYSAVFDATVDWQSKVATATSDVQHLFPVREWAGNPTGVTFRNSAEKLFFSVQLNAVLIQTLGFDSWKKNAVTHREAARTVFDAFRLREIKRAEFRTCSFFDLEMGHREMVDLMFGTFLPKRDLFEKLGGDFDDNSLQLWGKRPDYKIRVNVLPQTPEQVKTTFFMFPNLEAFIDPSNRLLETTISDAFAYVKDRPRLCVDASVYLEDTDIPSATALLTSCHSAAEELVQSAINIFLDL